MSFSGRCKMLRASRVLLVLSLLSIAGFAADRVGGAKSPTGAIFLRAVLAQSVSVSAEPQVLMFDSFVSSVGERNFPVTFKTRWVRGPGNVSVVVFSSPEWGVENQNVISVAPGAAPNWEIESGKLTFSSDSKGQVLTVRAQAI
jgi:hypothetical protein